MATLDAVNAVGRVPPSGAHDPVGLGVEPGLDP